jgi:hypothetical protein
MKAFNSPRFLTDPLSIYFFTTYVVAASDAGEVTFNFMFTRM